MKKGGNKKSLPARVQEKLLWFIWGGPAEFQGAQNALFLARDWSPQTDKAIGVSIQKKNITKVASLNELHAP